MTKYSEKLFLFMYDRAKKTGPAPDVCVCGSDLVAQEVLETLQRHGISMHVIADNEISSKSFWLTTHDDLAKLPVGGRN